MGVKSRTQKSPKSQDSNHNNQDLPDKHLWNLKLGIWILRLNKCGNLSRSQYNRTLFRVFFVGLHFK